MLRIVPIVMAMLRSKIGPNLTEKERSKAFLGLSPLNVPPNFGHADVTSKLVRLQLVLLHCLYGQQRSVPLLLGFSQYLRHNRCYTLWSFLFIVSSLRWRLWSLYRALSSWGSCFGVSLCIFMERLLTAGGRFGLTSSESSCRACWLPKSQVSAIPFVRPSDITNHSDFISFLVLGLLGLKKAAKQLPLFIPLPVSEETQREILNGHWSHAFLLLSYLFDHTQIITVLFNFYIRQQHFRVAAYLPTRECFKEDLRRDDDFDFSFVNGAYVQPPLAADPHISPDRSLLEANSVTEGNNIMWGDGQNYR